MLSAAFLLHLAAYDGYVSAVIDDIVPVVLQHLFHFHALGIYHQSAGLTVEPVYYMCRAFEMTLLEILVKYSLHAELAGIGTHTQYAWSFLDNDNILVLIHDFHILVAQFCAALMTADAHNLAWMQGMVKTCHKHAIYAYSVPFEQILYVVTAHTSHLLHDEIHELRFFPHRDFEVFECGILSAAEVSWHIFILIIYYFFALKPCGLFI